MELTAPELIREQEKTDDEWENYIKEADPKGTIIERGVRWMKYFDECQEKFGKQGGSHFSQFAKKRFGLHKSTASKWVAIGRHKDELFHNMQQFSEDWGAVYKFTCLKEKEKQALLAQDKPISQKTIKDTVTEIRKDEKETVPVDIPEITDRYQLHHCSVLELMDIIPAESVKWIITDPPYPKEFLDCYLDLSQFAKHALQPGGSLICMTGQSYLPEVMARLGQCMEYYWIHAFITHGHSANLRHKAINTDWKPLLHYVKGKYDGPHISDTFSSDKNEKDHHHWGQSISGMIDIVTRFSSAGETIIDPFLGGGTTCIASLVSERLFVGCDIDSECIQTSLGRINDTI